MAPCARVFGQIVFCKDVIQPNFNLEKPKEKAKPAGADKKAAANAQGKDNKKESNNKKESKKSAAAAKWIKWDLKV